MQLKLQFKSIVFYASRMQCTEHQRCQRIRILCSFEFPCVRSFLFVLVKQEMGCAFVFVRSTNQHQSSGQSSHHNGADKRVEELSRSKFHVAKYQLKQRMELCLRSCLFEFVRVCRTRAHSPPITSSNEHQLFAENFIGQLPMHKIVIQVNVHLVSEWMPSPHSFMKQRISRSKISQQTKAMYQTIRLNLAATSILPVMMKIPYSLIYYVASNMYSMKRVAPKYYTTPRQNLLYAFLICLLARSGWQTKASHSQITPEAKGAQIISYTKHFGFT